MTPVGGDRVRVGTGELGGRDAKRVAAAVERRAIEVTLRRVRGRRDEVPGAAGLVDAGYRDCVHRATRNQCFASARPNPVDVHPAVLLTAGEELFSPSQRARLWQAAEPDRDERVVVIAPQFAYR